MPVRISVILPTYNRSATLVAACRSVLTQSFHDLELIVVDDGSSEDVRSLVLAIGDPRVRYIRRARNGGAGAARNTGLAAATGEFVAFQDSDDLWLPNKLERQLAFMDGAPRAIGAVTGAKILYGCDDRLRFGSGKVTLAPAPRGRLRIDEDQVAHLLSENRISLQNALFRADCLPSRTWFDPVAKANEDWDFAIRLSQHTKICEDREPVVLAFMSGDSISSNPHRQITGVFRILRNNKRILKRYPRQHAALLFDVSRYLFKTGRSAWGQKFLVASLLRSPYGATLAVQSVMRKIRTRIGTFANA